MNALLITFGILAVAFFFAYLQMRRERDVLRFDIIHLNLETILDTWPVTKINQLKIMSYFDDLKSCRWQNTEKVQILWNTFAIKYKEVGREHLKEADEFELQDGDLDERNMKRFE